MTSFCVQGGRGGQKVRFSCVRTYWTFPNSDISSYARLQSLNSDSKQITRRINLKLRRVTPASGLEGFEELSTAYKFLVSEAPSRKNLKTKDSHIKHGNKMKSNFGYVVRLEWSCLTIVIYVLPHAAPRPLEIYVIAFDVPKQFNSPFYKRKVVVSYF